MPAVSVIVPARDAEATIGSALLALADQDLGLPVEVIVVDDGSTDATPELVRGFQPPSGMSLRLLTGPGSGPGPARNLGCEAAIAPVLAFTDADCRPCTDWLRRGLAALEGVDLVQGAVRPFPEQRRDPLDRTVWVVAEAGLYETANLLVRRAAFDCVGGFEDWLGPVIGKPLAEDVWLGWQVRRLGGGTRFCAEAVVEHAVFRRGVVEFALERRRLRYFPFMAGRIPELRTSMFFCRCFLSRRSAALDLALACLPAALCTKRLWPLMGLLPYGWIATLSAARWGRRAPKALAGETGADLVGAVALIGGSIRSRSPVL